MNKLGIQCQEGNEEVYRYNRKLLPVVVKSINILDPGHYARLAAENPGVDLVYRQVPNGPWGSAGDGRRWAEHLYGQVGHIPQITLVEGHNEWIHAPPHNAPEDFDKADRFMVELIDRVHELWGGRVHAVVLNASCGHFNEDIVDFFPRTLAKLQACGKCLLALHEYDHPSKDMLGDGGHNLCGKFLRNLAGLRAAGYDKVRIAITECGVDSGVGAPAGSGHVGFKYWGEMAWARYLNDRNLGWYLPLLQETGGVAWATLFGCGMEGGWASFDIRDTHVINGIGVLFENWVPPEEPPEPPTNGDDEMDIKVIDTEYNERDFKYAEDKYGVAFRRANVEPGQKVWRLVELWEKGGNHSLITQTLDEDGQALPNVPITFYWPNAPSPPDPPTTVYPHDWYNRFIWAKGNENGEVGPGMGSGAWIDVEPNPPYNAIGGGPHAVWIHDPNIPSDICEKLGMRGGTNHDHLDQKFQLMIEGENGNGNGDTVLIPWERLEFDHSTSMFGIAYPASVAIDTRGDGQGLGIDEDIHPVEWEHPDGARMALVEFCTDFNGDAPRAYTLRVYRMSDGASLTNTEAETFQPLGYPRKRVIYVYVEEEGEPPEPPVDGDLLEEVTEIRLLVAEIRDFLTDWEPTEPPVPPIDPEEAFQVQYYDNPELEGEPVLTRREVKIDHFWGAGSPGPPVPTDYFSARWRGSFSFEAGTYEFHALVDDGFRLWVDGTQILDVWKPQSPTRYDVALTLSAGKHEIVAEYYEQAGGATCKLWWD